MDRHLVKGLAVALPLAVAVAWLENGWPIGVVFLALALVAALGGTIMMRSLGAAERRKRQRDPGSSSSSGGGWRKV